MISNSFFRVLSLSDGHNEAPCEPQGDDDGRTIVRHFNLITLSGEKTHEEVFYL